MGKDKVLLKNSHENTLFQMQSEQVLIFTKHQNKFSLADVVLNLSDQVTTQFLLVINRAACVMLPCYFSLPSLQVQSRQSNRASVILCRTTLDVCNISITAGNIGMQTPWLVAYLQLLTLEKRVTEEDSVSWTIPAGCFPLAFFFMGSSDLGRMKTSGSSNLVLAS